MDKVYQVPVTKRGASMIIAGGGALMVLLGMKPEFPDLLLRLHKFGEGFNATDAENTQVFEMTQGQLQYAVAAVAAITALQERGSLESSPHTVEQMNEFGERLSGILDAAIVNKPSGAIADGSKIRGD